MSEGALERKSAERPAKSAAKPAQSEGAGEFSSPAPPPEAPETAPRKRGRPRKTAPATQAAPSPPRKRGRPRKHPLPPEPMDGAPRKRGRPRKHPLPAPAAAAPVAAAAPSDPAPPGVAAVGDPATAANVAAAPPPSPPPAREKPAAAQPGASSALPALDFNALALNMARFVEEGGKALAAYMRPLESGKTSPDLAEHVEDAVKTLGHVAEYWMADPRAPSRRRRHCRRASSPSGATTMRRFAGENVPPVAAPDPGDKRFSDPEWRTNPMFDFLRQAYVIATRWANELVDKAEGVDPGTRDKAKFYLRQIAGALSPSNFIGTNPELLRTTLSENGENLVRGMKMLAEDIEAGKRRPQDPPDRPEQIRARTRSRHDARQGRLSQRTDGADPVRADDEQVFKRPLLIVPPWINKFYVLDLNPEKSFVRCCVEQGPDRLRDLVGQSGRAAGRTRASRTTCAKACSRRSTRSSRSTGERKVTAIGYCVGGTLLGDHARLDGGDGRRPHRQRDAVHHAGRFHRCGRLKLFVDEERIGALEEKMARPAISKASKMATAFNMLRPNELIWSYVVNNYLKGKEPMPFDLLTWNSDSTRMPAANHSFYLRNCYLENRWRKGEMVIAGATLDLKT